MKCLILTCLLALHTIPVLAQGTLRGKVAVDGAAVYSKPDFDSEVVDYLNQGIVVPISHRQFTGQGGLGLFYKIKTPSGKFGFITDTDVILPKDAGVVAPSAPHQHAPNKKKAEMEEQEREKEREREREKDTFRKPFYATRYFGGTIGMIDYGEKFSGQTLQQFTPFFGLRLTGPDIVFHLPVDINFLAYPFAPRYLSAIGSGTASGFLLLGDFDFFFPLVQKRTWLIHYGLGPMLTFSDYKVTVGGVGYDSQDLRLGFDFDVGYAYRFKTYAIRADAKYYLEKSQYLGFLVSFEAEY